MLLRFIAALSKACAVACTANAGFPSPAYATVFKTES